MKWWQCEIAEFQSFILWAGLNLNSIRSIFISTKFLFQLLEQNSINIDQVLYNIYNITIFKIIVYNYNIYLYNLYNII